MLQYRITKYNPAHRDASGDRLLEKWTSYSEIGQSIGNVLLTSALVPFSGKMAEILADQEFQRSSQKGLQFLLYKHFSRIIPSGGTSPDY
jgi:hypothetical protein